MNLCISCVFWICFYVFNSNQSWLLSPHLTNAQYYYSHQMSCHFQNTKAQCQMACQLLLETCILDIGLMKRCIKELEEDNDDDDNDLDLGNGIVRPSGQEQLQQGHWFQLQAISYAHKVFAPKMDHDIAWGFQKTIMDLNEADTWTNYWFQKSDLVILAKNSGQDCNHSYKVTTIPYMWSITIAVTLKQPSFSCCFVCHFLKGFIQIWRKCLGCIVVTFQIQLPLLMRIFSTCAFLTWTTPQFTENIFHIMSVDSRENRRCGNKYLVIYRWHVTSNWLAHFAAEIHVLFRT